MSLSEGHEALLTYLLPGVASVAHFACILTFDPNPHKVLPAVYRQSRERGNICLKRIFC
jgi:hypothetical protein